MFYRKIKIFLLFLLCIIFISKAETFDLDNNASGMVLIPAGEFIMGTDRRLEIELCEKYRNCEKMDWNKKSCSKPFKEIDCNEFYQNFSSSPEHKVYLPDYYIDIYEVTFEKYINCLNDGGCPNFDYLHKYNKDWPFLTPYHWVAETYCKWDGKRMPTEAEWEKADKGNTRNIFPWGDEYTGKETNLCDKNCKQKNALQYVDDGYAKLAPVGSFPLDKSIYGVMDMGGNASEWCSDWHNKNYYKNSHYNNPKGPRFGHPIKKLKVIRGGAYDQLPPLSTTTFRSSASETTFVYISFRCAMNAE